MSHLVALVTLIILPVLFIISAGLMAFSVTIVASTTASTAFLGKLGALGLCHLGDESNDKALEVHMMCSLRPTQCLVSSCLEVAECTFLESKRIIGLNALSDWYYVLCKCANHF
jgi:hypothetical protein